MNKYISEFLRQVCHQIKYKKIHRDISKELLGHIDEIKDEYIENGMTEEEAIKRAVKQMGNPIDIGKDLNKTHKPKTEWSIVLLITMMILVGGGVLISIARDTASSISMSQFLKSYLVYTFLGIMICLACYFSDYTKLEKYSLHIFVATIIFLFIGKWFSNTINGIPYIVIGPISFRPVSTAIPLFLISFPGLLTRWKIDNAKDMLKLFVLTVLAIYMCLMQPSLVSAMLLGCGFLSIFTIAMMNKKFKGKRKKLFFLIYGSAIGGLGLILFLRIIHSPYILKRLYSFFNPKQDPLGQGYIYLTMQKILSGARLFGKGDGLYINHQSIGGKFALPMINSEFVFTYIVSAFGWIAGIVVILISLLTILRMFLAIERIYSTYGKYVAASIVTVFSLQIIGNILMNLGIFPLMGISLPLISYGGSDCITNMALIGFMLGIYRRKDLILAGHKGRE